MNNVVPPKVFLIGGTSHAGKTSVAARLAERVGGASLSTDSLARHPGRPWRPDLSPPPPHVASHYRDLGVEALIESVLAHYRRLWPRVRELVERHAADPLAAPLVVEGSALLPDLVAELRRPDMAAFWLTADEALLAARMRRESRFDEADEASRALIAAFLERTKRFQQLTDETVRSLGLTHIVVTPADSVERVAQRVLDRVEGREAV